MKQIEGEVTRDGMEGPPHERKLLGLNCRVIKLHIVSAPEAPKLRARCFTARLTI
jgi:hypothetical protein